MDANQYVSLTPIEHIYTNPSFYLGSEYAHPRTEWIFNFETGRMTKTTITLPQAVERTFLEVLSNTGDNVFRSRQNNIDPGRIEVEIDPTTITVTNGGQPIPIEINQQTQLYAPEMIFGNLHTSSNYTGNRSGCGMYGVGVKVTNVFSTDFRVEIGDPIRQASYIQEWGPRMVKRGEALIQSYQGPAFVKVRYRLDFPRFGLQSYPPETLGLFFRRAADLSLNARVPIYFNGQLIPATTLGDYGSLFFGSVKQVILNPPFEVQRLNRQRDYIPDDTRIDLSLGFFDTPQEGIILGLVNGLPVNAGTHLKGVTRALQPFLEGVKLKRGKKEASGVKLTLTDLLPHLSVIVVVHLQNPGFVGGTKSELSDPAFKIHLPEESLKQLNKFSLMHQLYAALSSKSSLILSKTDGKKREYLELEKGEDANFAGGKHSPECTLMIVEGLSARALAAQAISLKKNGRDYFGIFPLKGKIMNVTDRTAEKIANNLEIAELKKMLGLRQGLDYTQEENFRTLRYGRVLLMTDEDEDGKHIKALVFNIFHCHFKSLLIRGYVMYLRTPILRVFFNQQRLKFYTQAEYRAWRDQTPNYASWAHRYYKGLGTSTKAEIEEEFQGQMGPRTVVALYDDQAPHALDLAFSQKLADARKAWIGSWAGIFQTANLTHQPISSFIHEEYIEYAVLCLRRAIPSVVDGLKVSQRKALWAAKLRWNLKAVGVRDAIKVAQFAAFAADRTQYHHGEVSMDDLIIKMAQDFVGSNNLPYFVQDGQFGTRDLGGKDAAKSRYLFTRPEWWLSYVYRKEDLPILIHVVDEGEEVEPEFFLPIIPIVLVNGAHGVAVGYSTHVPNHHPLNLVAWLKARLTGQVCPPVLPWYRGFRGRLEINQGRLISEGLISHQGGDQFLITELPIGEWTQHYVKWLEKQIKEKNFLKIRNLSTITQVQIEVTRTPRPEPPSLKEFNLVEGQSVKNAVLLDVNQQPIIHPSAESILEAYFSVRLEGYRRRKVYQLDELRKEIRDLEDRAKFITAVMEKRLIIERRKKEEIRPEMERMNLPYELLEKVRTVEFTKDELQKLMSRTETKIAEYQELEKKSIEEIWFGELTEFEEAYRKAGLE